MAYGQQGSGYQNPSLLVANIVEIVGTKGRLLVYSGSPALGDLVASIAGVAGSDKFTNPYDAGFDSNDLTTKRVTNINGSVITFYSRNAATRITAGSLMQLVDAFANSTTPALLMRSPITSADKAAYLFLEGGSQDGTGPSQVLINRVGSAGSIGTALTEIDDQVVTTLLGLAVIPGDTNYRFTVDSNGLMSWGPGNAATDVSLKRSSGGTLEVVGSLAISNSLQVLVNTILAGVQMSSLDMTGSGTNYSGNPLIADSWHSLGTFPTAGVSTVVGRYRLLPDGDVEIDILLSTSAAVATFSANFPNTLPAAYLPTQSKICAIGATGAAWVINGDRLPNCLVTTGGVVQVNMPAIPGAVANIGCTFRYPTT